jgi:hypothetical protein
MKIKNKVSKSIIYAMPDMSIKNRKDNIKYLISELQWLLRECEDSIGLDNMIIKEGKMTVTISFNKI